MDADVADRLADLADRYELPARSEARLSSLLDLVAAEPSSITTVRDPAEGVDAHIADSLVALDVDEARAAHRVADLGSGGGFPGLVLAVALPGASVSLVESVSRKCAFLRRAVSVLGLANVEVVNARVEEWADGIATRDLVVARALAPLGALVEYAAPLLVLGGALIAWKGRRDPTEEADGRAAATTLGMTEPQARPVWPFPGTTDRHLYLSLKVSKTPSGYPRRVGMARKRPIRASGRR